MGYMVDLEAFHGPLDLLLYLIEKNEVDIYDIPIAKITDQYMDYLNKTGDIDIEKLGDFLVLASYLLSLKSKMLLPKHHFEENNTDADADIDPRDELVQRLLEYKKFKEIAQQLSSMQQGEEPRVFFRQSSYSPETNEVLIADVRTLVRAYKEVINRLSENETSFEIPTGDINVAEKMEEILNELYSKPVGLVFQDLFINISTKREALAYFLALLELIRIQKVQAVQKDVNDLIIINLMGEINDDEK
ncbi:MAG: segregation/condensation protein A [Syntrophomonadaceae bacterium]|nr:segregation/condensation protein A [Syntrophomonadaceae bacterium]